jgi:hypothetical protein
MTRILFIVLLSCIQVVNSQEKKWIEPGDVVFENGYTKYRNIQILTDKADKSLVKVPLSLSFPDSIYKASGMTEQKLNTMMFTACANAMYSCKNKYTYEPKEISIFYDSLNKMWASTVIFTAQNDYGAVKDGREAVYFDAKGDKELSRDEFIEAINSNKPKIESEKEKRKRIREESKQRN